MSTETEATDHGAVLDGLPNQQARVRYACEQMPPDRVQTKYVREWLAEYGRDIPRQTASTVVKAYRDERRMSDTAAQAFSTEDLFSRLEADMAADTTAPAPRQDEPLMLHPIPPDAEGDAVTTVSLNPPDASVTVAPRQDAAPDASAVTDDAAPDASPLTPDAEADSPAEALTPPGDAATERQDAPADESKKKDGPGWFARGLDWLEAKSFALLYLGLLTYATYGLYEVLVKLADSPKPVAAIGAGAVELIGISLKRAADKAARNKESHLVVRLLYALAGSVALGVAVTNLLGHMKLVANVSAVTYATASLAGFGLWFVLSWLKHRADLRKAGQLEGPGLRIPAYVHDRYGKRIATRAQRVSRLDPDMEIDQAVKRARAEIAQEDREAREQAEREARQQRERARHEALLAALEAHAHATLSHPLAAALEAAEFNPDKLASMMTASTQRHQAKAVELDAWKDQFRRTIGADETDDASAAATAETD